ncbi:MAG: Na+/H+ antiporter NhaA [Solirubrobacterales bacterium]|nr:Na+/H+ antiporter NhaA [Solirubrobacterales bacterium]
MKTNEFIRSEVAGGAVLLVAVVIAMVWANAPFGDTYYSFWHTELTIGIGDASITNDLQHWVNDGLMAIFFFVVGLEIKRELTVGELNSRKKASLPVIAALGGVVLPALVFVALNAGGSGADGWAIPMATDIAFAVAVLALLGSRIPAGVRLFLLSIAIVDDVIAITVIALFYSGGIHLVWLAVGVLGLGLITGMERIGVHRILPFVAVGFLVWIGFHSSGVHATVAGVALGLLTPARPVKGRMVLEELEHDLHPYTSLLIVPIFALANAGIALSFGVVETAASNAIFWGILLGLVAGKTLGIGLATFAAKKLNLAETPEGVLPIHVWGIAALGGIGFTVSIFIAQLAFVDPDLIETAKVGIFSGSLIAAILGSVILIRSPVPDGVPTVADLAAERQEDVGT